MGRGWAYMSKKNCRLQGAAGVRCLYWAGHPEPILSLLNSCLSDQSLDLQTNPSVNHFSVASALGCSGGDASFSGQSRCVWSVGGLDQQLEHCRASPPVSWTLNVYLHVLGQVTQAKCHLETVPKSHHDSLEQTCILAGAPSGNQPALTFPWAEQRVTFFRTNCLCFGFCLWYESVA